MGTCRETLQESIAYSSISTLIALALQYLLFYSFGIPLLTERIAEWGMARTPSRYAVSILDFFGAWAKPFAMTGALAAIGFTMFLARRVGSHFRVQHRHWATALLSTGLLGTLIYVIGYSSIQGAFAFGVPAVIALVSLGSRRTGVRRNPTIDTSMPAWARREFVLRSSSYWVSLLSATGIVGIAGESYLRNEVLARRAAEPRPLFPFHPQLQDRHFGGGLARKSVTPVSEFYGMSKNATDPVVDARTWRLKISIDGNALREFRYSELLALPKQLRYQTLRCISNTLNSDLMGTAQWSGISLSQLVDRRSLPVGIIEAALIGLDGHDDSIGLEYAFGGELMLGLGMNGSTLPRTHGFPIRVLAPRYYGCRNVKWLSEIRFVSKPYSGTWQRLGYTREPIVHIASHVDRMMRANGKLRAGGVSFSGDRGISAVRIRANQGPWTPAVLEPPLSDYTWTRWCAELEANPGDLLEANAQDRYGSWQELSEGKPFPSGLAGPTLVRVNV